ncbi:fatty acid hydroxylase superfamily-domain-containing protein [Gongronella butleri]|nr:fatty acid hydroxylase superfamily-domain-containing protein [Gongronella butleri]
MSACAATPFTPSCFLQGFGRLFYMVSPTATAYTNWEDVPDFIAEAIPFFVMTITIETLALAVLKGGAYMKKERSWDAHRFSVNDLVGSIGAGMLQQISQFFIYNITVASYLYVYNHFRVVDLDPKNIYVWIAGFLIVDLGYYAFHRAAHEVNLFWATHVVHHSSEYYNQSTALRQSIFQSYCSWIFDLPAALFLPPSLYAVHKQFNTLFQFWIHTEMIGNLGPLEYIINTPSAHRVHHGRNPYCIDKNYAGTLIIWDILFGTFELERVAPAVQSEKDTERVAYGLTHPINTFDPLTIQFHHLRHVLTTCWSTPGFSNKFKVLFYGPGWHDDTPRTGLLEEIPPIAKDIPPAKYDLSVPTSINVYVLVHFALLIAANAITLNGKKSQPMEYHVIVLVSAYVLGSLTSFGRIFDHKPLAIATECLRNLAAAGILAATSLLTPLVGQAAPYLAGFHVFSALFLLVAQKNYATAVTASNKTKTQ